MSQGAFLLPCLEVYVGKGVYFVQHYVDVVATNSGRYDRDALSVECAGYGVELAALDVTLLSVKMRRNQPNAARVAHQYDLVGQLFGSYVQVEHTAIRVNDQF